MFSWLSLHVHFRRRVVLVEEFFYWVLLTSSWDPIQVQGVYRETALRRGRDCEGSRHVALSNIFCIKFFWTIV